MRNLNKSVVSFFLVLLFAVGFSKTLSAATTFYVANNGSDSNPGTLGSPFQTIVHGIGKMRAGDTLLIRAGTYSESFNGVYGAAGTPNGTSFSNAINIAAYPDESVTWTYTGGDDIFGLATDSFPAHRSFYYILTGITFDGAYLVNFPIGGLYGDYLRMVNCEVKGGLHSGILVGGDYSEFLNLKVHNNGTNGNQDHGIYMGTANGLIDGGEYYNNKAYGIQVYSQGASDHTNNTVVRNTKIYGNAAGNPGAGGLILASGSNVIAYNNLIYNNGNTGASISESGYCSGCALYNNTIYGNSQIGVLVGSNTFNSQVVNNIVYDNGAGIMDRGSSSGINNNFTSNPSFTDPPNGDFTIQSFGGTTPAAVDLSSIFRTDFAGAPRPTGSEFGVGALVSGSVVTAVDTTPPNVSISISSLP